MSAWLEQIRKTPREERPETPNVEVTAEMREWGKDQALNILERLARAPQGSRNNTANLCAFKMGQLVARGVVEQDKAWQVLEKVTQQWDGEVDYELTSHTITSGMTAGLSNPFEPWPPNGLGERPFLEVSQVGDFADSLANLIGKGPLSGICQRGSELVRFRMIGEDGYQAAAKGDDNGPGTIQTMNRNSLAAIVDETFFVGETRTTKNGSIVTHQLAPKEAVERAMVRALDRKSARQVELITHTPIVKPDGSILNTPGYHADYKVMYLPNGTAELKLDWSSAKEAREFLGVENSREGVFGEFSWSGNTDQERADALATFLALIITPMMVLISPPPYPLFVFTARSQGTGKTLLTKCAGELYGRVTRGISQDPNEFHKAVTSLLLGTTGRIVCFDNIEGEIGSDDLSRLLTEPTWGDRKLGSNTEVEIPNDRLWCATANNAQVSADQRRRSLWSQLDADCEKPWERTDFSRVPLDLWVRQHKAEVLGAAAFLVSDWIKAGAKKGSGGRTDDFADWIGKVNGILEHSSAIGRVGRTERESGLVEDADWAALLAGCYGTYGNSTFTMKRISWDVELTALVDAVITRGKNDSRLLGKAFAKREGKWVNGHKAVKVGLRDGIMHWQVETK